MQRMINCKSKRQRCLFHGFPFYELLEINQQHIEKLNASRVILEVFRGTTEITSKFLKKGLSNFSKRDKHP